VVLAGEGWPLGLAAVVINVRGYLRSWGHFGCPGMLVRPVERR
jgi:hypothetical protein